MAQDVKLEKGVDDIFDIPVENSDLATVDGVETAVFVSLFTDARAPAGTVKDAFRRRGWSGNILTLQDGFELGGLLWTLDQARLTQNTLNEGEDVVRISLQWVIDDGIADTVEVAMEQTGTRQGTITIELFKGIEVVGRYTTVWLSTQPIP